MLSRCRLVFSSVFWEQNTISLPCMLRASLTKHFCTNSEVVGKDLAAEEWLKNISPELKLKKKTFESELHILQESGVFTEYQVTARDWKTILEDCYSVRAFRKYLSFREVSMYKERNAKAKKRLSQEAHEARVLNGPFDPDIHGLYSYTRYNNSQETRVKKNIYAMIQMTSAVPVVFDMDYSVSRREEIQAYMQILESISVNRMSPDPCAIHLTSYTKNRSLEYDKKENLCNSFVTLHEERFDEVFPVEKLVYLSPNAPQLVHHQPGDIYVIGGLVDIKDTSHASLRKAKQLNIRCGSFPFFRHAIRPGVLSVNRGSVLTLNQVMELVLAINLHHDWTYVMNGLKEKLSDRQRFSRTDKKPKHINRASRFL